MLVGDDNKLYRLERYDNTLGQWINEAEHSKAYCYRAYANLMKKHGANAKMRVVETGKILIEGGYPV